MPELTVMMPAHNAERTITAAIKTTLRALPLDSELVVMDDGSTDRTLEVASSIEDNRLRLFRSGSSVGGGLARQHILDNTDSRIVAAMDADDICLPWRFRLQRNMLNSSDIAFGAAIMFGSSPRHYRLSYPVCYNSSDSRLALLFHNPFIHPTLIARRDALDVAGGYADLRLAQDYELWLRAAARGLRIHRSAAYVVLYRRSRRHFTVQPRYVETLRTSRRLWESYKALAEVVLGGIRLNGESPGELSEATRLELLRRLDGAISTMGVQHRVRYRKYLRRGLLTLPL